MTRASSRRFRRLGPLLVAGLLAACGSSSPTDNNGQDGDILAAASLQFLPPDKTVTVGTQVTWGFGAVAHTVVFDDVAGHPANIASPTANAVVGRTFTTVGNYPYHCTIHAGMMGIVHVVTSAVVVPPAPPPPPPPPTPGYP